MTQSHPGQIPAGMLRIHQGNQEHYVWPVHLPGWLLLGWRVAGSGNAPDAGPLPQVVTAAADAPDMDPDLTAALDGAQPATGRGKRGRRRKEEEQPTAAADDTAMATAQQQPESAAAISNSVVEDRDGDSDPLADSELTDARSSTEPIAASAASDVATEPAAESGAVPAAADPVAAEASTEPDVSLSALPDDLFEDPLI